MKHEKHEKLPPALFLESICERREIIKGYINSLGELLIKLPKGRLHLSEHKGHPQYYHVFPECPKKNGKYIGTKKQSLIKGLATREYYERIIPIMNDIVRLDDQLVEKEELLVHAYESLNWKKKIHVIPVTLTENEYSKRWLDIKYEGKPFLADDKEYYSTNGLRVRSKSEIMLADMLDEMKIPYRYEYPVSVADDVWNPDFYCLNVRTRQEFIWEHFGMMGDAGYRNKVEKKMQIYALEGYVPGKNLIITMESTENPLNIKCARIIAEALLM